MCIAGAFDDIDNVSVEGSAGINQGYVNHIIRQLLSLAVLSAVAPSWTPAAGLFGDVSWSNVSFPVFSGETMDPDAMSGILIHEDKPDGNEAPYFYFFKHGLLEEKC